MRELEQFSRIPIKRVQTSGVQALSERPNTNDRYGKGGLSSEQLKLWFDNLATLLVRHANTVSGIWAQGDATKFVKLADTMFANQDFVSLYDLLEGIVKGTLAHELIVKLTTYPEQTSAPTGSLWEYPLDDALNKILQLIKNGEEVNQGKLNEIWDELAYSAEGSKHYEGTGAVGTDAYAMPYLQFKFLNRMGASTTQFTVADTGVKNNDIPNYLLTERMFKEGSVSARAIANGAVGSTELSGTINGIINGLRDNAYTDVTYDTATGVLTFTGGSATKSINLPLDSFVEDGFYNPDTDEIILTLKDGNPVHIPVTAMINDIATQVEGALAKLKLLVTCTSPEDANTKSIQLDSVWEDGETVAVLFQNGNSLGRYSVSVTTCASGQCSVNTYPVKINGGSTAIPDNKLKVKAGYICLFRRVGLECVMLNPQSSGGAEIDDTLPSAFKVWSSQKVFDELVSPEHSTMVVTISKVGAGGYVADYTSSQIINHAQTGVVIAKYVDDATGETRTYQYTKQTQDRRAVFSKDGYIENGISKQTLIYVDFEGKIEVETRETQNYTLPKATETALGGIKAKPATTEDTQEVHIDADGNLKTKAGGGKVVEEVEVLPPVDFAKERVIYAVGKSEGTKLYVLWNQNALPTPANLSVNETTVTWNAVPNATIYGLRVDSQDAGTVNTNTVDVTILSLWGGLADGNHTVYIRAIGDGYDDSAEASITVEKKSVLSPIINPLNGESVSSPSTNWGESSNYQYQFRNGTPTKVKLNGSESAIGTELVIASSMGADATVYVSVNGLITVSNGGAEDENFSDDIWSSLTCNVEFAFADGTTATDTFIARAVGGFYG